MNRNTAFILLTLIFLSGLSIESTHAFGIPKIKRKKRKDKSDQKKKAKEDNAKADEKDNKDNKENSKPDATEPKATPAEQSAKEPKSEPAAAKKPEPAIQETIANLTQEVWDEQYKHLKVGDFTLYGFGKENPATTRNEVIATDDISVTVLTTTKSAGYENKNKIRYVNNSTSKTTEKSVSLGDKKINVKVIETTIDGKLAMKYTSSEDVPLGGVVKSEGADGKVHMELLDFKKQ